MENQNVRQILTSTEFKKKLSESGNVFTISDSIITEKLHISKEDFKSKTWIITNCTFQYVVNLNNVNIANQIVFLRCEFIGNLSFHECTSMEVRTTDKDRQFTVCLENCLFQNFDLTQPNAFSSGLMLTECRGKTLRIRNLKLKNRGIRIRKIDIEKMSLNNIECESTIEGISISESTVKDTFNLADVTCLKVRIRHSKFLEQSNVRNCVVRESLSILENTFISMLTFQDIECKSMHLIGGDYQTISVGSVSSANFNINTLFIRTPKCKNKLVINGRDRVGINANPLEKIDVVSSEETTGIIQIENCGIDHLSLSGINLKSIINVRDVLITNLTFNNFFNYGNMTFSSLRNPGELHILSSDLGKGKFIDLEFSPTTHATIDDAVISDISLSSITWFDKMKISTGSVFDIKKLREIFRQLKQASEKHGDRIEALKFQALELKAFEKEVASRNKFSVNDRLILWLSKTNDFGLNWIRPLVLLICLTFLFYIPMVVCASDQLTSSVSFNLADINFTRRELWNYSGMFIQLFNPAHNLSSMLPKEQLSNEIFWLDGILRIITAFFIVQIVSAFRKYIR